MNEDVTYIIQQLNNHGYEAFIVGGCVRDMILDRESNDFDITTSAKPLEVKNIFEKTFDTGIEHGTVTVVLNKENYEVTTYRIDGEYEDNRRPTEVIYTNNLEEDLLRRDFTMNAIAYHNELGFIDPFGGQEDIGKKIIKGVGDPDKRFKEDALRIMRAVRFSAQLDFTIEDDTYNALIKNIDLLANISIERVRDELLKLLLSDNPEKIKLVNETKVFMHINEDIYKYLLQHETKIVKSLKDSDNALVIRLSLLFQFYNTDKLESILHFLRLDNKSINAVVIVVSNLNVMIEETSYGIKKLVNKIGKDGFVNLIETKKAITKKSYSNIIDIYIKALNEPIFIKDLNINGNDLKNCGVKNGKFIGEVLLYLMDIVLKSPELNEKDKLIQFISSDYLEEK